MSVQPSPAAVRRAVLASVVGNGLEWYDYMIYGFYAALLAGVFFPAENELLGALFYFASVGVAFIVRPIGGVLIGIYADRYGRKPALTLMILLMGASTVLIGLTPTYATIGIFAPIIVVCARICQGLSVGGEFASATSMLTEYAKPNQKMFFGSFQTMSQALATVIAAGVGYILGKLLTDATMAEWGWRIPFILGALIAPVGFYIRRNVDESPEFQEMQQAAQTKPHTSFFGSTGKVLEVIGGYWRGILAGFGVIAFGATTNYIWFVYLTHFAATRLDLPLSQVLLTDVFSGGLLFLLCPVTGYLADKFGAMRILTIGFIGFAGLAYPFVAYVVEAPSFERLVTVHLAMAIPISFIWGPTPGFLSGLFPTAIRSTGMSLVYNWGVLLFGGFAPSYVAAILYFTENDMVPAYYILMMSLVGTLLLIASRVGKKQSMATT